VRTPGIHPACLPQRQAGLAQAEAIADLIDAGSREALRAAMRSLQGEFSAMVHGLTEAVIEAAHLHRGGDRTFRKKKSTF